MKPATFAQMLSATLYERRFGPYFVSPVVAGLDDQGTPYLAGMDSIGAIETAKDFMVAGTAQDSLYGMCESMYQPDLVCGCIFQSHPLQPITAIGHPCLHPTPIKQEAEDLFELTAQCLLSGVDRDALSGWGAILYVVTKDGITVRQLKGRMD